MIHPSTEVRKKSDEVGYGVFATRLIPMGTIVYAQDPYEIVIGPEEFASLSPVLQQQFETYSFIDAQGNRIVSWDIGKYVNHCCHPNTISTGYGFEIAVRDIQPGEEITDEYGIFNLQYEMNLLCTTEGCRKTLRPEDFETYAEKWDAQIKPALQAYFQVPQPLADLVPEEVRAQLEDYRRDPRTYRSVYTLRHKSLVPQKS